MLRFLWRVDLMKGSSCLNDRIVELLRGAGIAIAPDDVRSVEAHLYRIKSSHYPVELRCESARAIGRLGPKAAPAVRSLKSFRTAWDNDRVMREVVTALGKIGPAASEAIGMLEDLADEVFWDDELVGRAQRALAQIRR